METTAFTSTILVDKTPGETFNAIRNLKAWWSEDIEGETDKPGEAFFYHYKDKHLTKMKLIEMVANERLVYLILANEFSFIRDKTEWVNTKLIFEISTEGKKTKVSFVHEGLVPEYECYDVCHNAWTGLIQHSLKDLIGTGKGQPIPKDLSDETDREYVRKWRDRH